MTASLAEKAGASWTPIGDDPEMSAEQAEQRFGEAVKAYQLTLASSSLGRQTSTETWLPT